MTKFCGLTNIYDVVFHFSFPCWSALPFPVWCVPKSYVHSSAAHGIVAGCPLLVIGVVPGLGKIGTVMALSRLVSACETICVWLTPRWPFFIIFGRPGVVAGLIDVLVVVALR